MIDSSTCRNRNLKVNNSRNAGLPGKWRIADRFEMHGAKLRMSGE